MANDFNKSSKLTLIELGNDVIVNFNNALIFGSWWFDSLKSSLDLCEIEVLAYREKFFVVYWCFMSDKFEHFVEVVFCSIFHSCHFFLVWNQNINVPATRLKPWIPISLIDGVKKTSFPFLRANSIDLFPKSFGISVATMTTSYFKVFFCKVSMSKGKKASRVIPLSFRSCSYSGTELKIETSYPKWFPNLAAMCPIAPTPKMQSLSFLSCWSLSLSYSLLTILNAVTPL